MQYRKKTLRLWGCACLLAGALFSPALFSNAHQLTVSASFDFCASLAHGMYASTGARTFCQVKSGERRVGLVQKQIARRPQVFGEIGVEAPARNFGNNIDAGNPHEDQTPAGAQIYFQSETSVAAVGQYVVEAWNDGTGMALPCPAAMYVEELTGFGFSSDGGKSFADLGGLPNGAPNLCATTSYRYFGDPSVEAWQTTGGAYFYVSSLYEQTIPPFGSALALDACKASGTGAAATLTCGDPVLVATGDISKSEFLDKPFLSIDAARGRLYMSYSRFGQSGSGQIELAVCDITRPNAPVCNPGASTAPYLVVAPGDLNCESDGAYPAVDVASGSVYVAWEWNIASGLFNPSCFNVSTQNKVAYMPFTCLTLTPASPCGMSPLTKAIDITSMEAAVVPGYSRFPMQDFPRIAVSDLAGTVSIVWNDARRAPTGDILLQSFKLVTLDNLQSHPIQLNSETGFKWKYLPALRQADKNGLLNVSWYDRRTLSGASTDVWAALNVDPRLSQTPNNIKVTTEASDWNAISSDFGPNFGDYTDNYVLATANDGYTGESLYVAWTDGRMGLPQPFVSKARDESGAAG
jgi:hypothetical protein